MDYYRFFFSLSHICVLCVKYKFILNYLCSHVYLYCFIFMLFFVFDDIVCPRSSLNALIKRPPILHVSKPLEQLLKLVPHIASTCLMFIDNDFKSFYCIMTRCKRDADDIYRQMLWFPFSGEV